MRYLKGLRNSHFINFLRNIKSEVNVFLIESLMSVPFMTIILNIATSRRFWVQSRAVLPSKYILQLSKVYSLIFLQCHCNVMCILMLRLLIENVFKYPKKLTKSSSINNWCHFPIHFLVPGNNVWVAFPIVKRRGRRRNQGKYRSIIEYKITLESQ